MRYLGCLWLCLVSWISHADDSEIFGSMACEVKSSSIIEIKDGIAKQYGGISGRFGVGDTLSLDYKLINMRLVADLIDKKRDHIEMSFTVNIRDMVSFREDISIAIFDSGDVSATFGLNYLRFNLLANELMLHRYYKDDWNGHATVYYGDGLHVYTVDCKHSQESVDMIFELMKQSHFAEIPG